MTLTLQMFIWVDQLQPESVQLKQCISSFVGAAWPMFRGCIQGRKLFFRIFDLHENHDENLTVEFIATIREIFQMLLDHSLHSLCAYFQGQKDKSGLYLVRLF